MKNWYYVDSMEVYGPFNKEEISAKFTETEIDDNNYFWCSGMKVWKKLKLSEIENLSISIKSESLMPGLIELLDSKDKAEHDTGNVFLKISGILLILIGLFNLILGIIYINYPDMAVTNGINTISGLAILFIGYGVIKFNQTAYKWALGTSGLSLFLLVIEYFTNSHFDVTLIFFIFILYSLVRYKKLFK